MASNKNVVRGVDKVSDLDPSLIARDTRSFRHRFASMFVADQNAGFVMMVFGGGITILPILGFTLAFDPLLFLGFFFWLYARNKVTVLQYKTPQSIDSNGNVINDGIALVGNDLIDGSEIWYSNDDLRTHMLVFGSTGSGKTRFLLGILYQALMFGSGCLYCDGKGDNTVWWLVFTFCRRVGREDDLLVMNYLTGGEKFKRGADKKLGKISNTNNPFAFGDHTQLRSLIVGLMRESGGDGDMWKGMASAMMSGLLKALVDMRDTGEINLDVSVIREHLPLDQIVKLARRTDIDPIAIAPIKKYLAEIPGYVEEEAMVGRINPKVYEQHGYRSMQFSEILSDLEDTYGHIFAAPLGEIDFKDVVFHRRVLFVMLPALEKDPDALAGLGKLVVAGVRSALAPALGLNPEGREEEVIKTKPTNSKVPFFLILDEYGYYSVKGFAVVAAQARSLGVSVIFAGQDYPSFKKSSPEEAQATIANTNIKISMKVEEDETAKIFIDRADDASVNVTAGSERTNDVLSTNYKDSEQVRIEKVKRVSYRDLVSQKAGQAHVLFGDELCRSQLFYAEPTNSPEAYLNKFVMVNNPSKTRIDAINNAFGTLQDHFNNAKNKAEMSEQEEDVEEFSNESNDIGLSSLISDYKLSVSRGEDNLNSAILATGFAEWRENNKDAQLNEDARIANEVKSNQTNQKIETATPATDSAKSPLELESLLKDQDEEMLVAIDTKETPDSSVKNEANEFSKSFEKLLTETVVNDIEKKANRPLTQSERQKSEPRNALEQIEKISGASETKAKEESKRGMDILSQRSRYPTNPTPSKKTKEFHLDLVYNLIHEVDTTEA
ncbi:TraM recognition domain-containing protein [Psychromonas sp. SP041]|uniref:TraM recognition domain-containing protein n=1 Tax=Psychromonas sp. SP041 TaxID=1365007 RepID=UPI0010C7CE28|nr:TraM recognition domain-containing protein [Psychromonas sp. SP041]